MLTAQKVDMMFRFAERRQPSEDKCLDQMWNSGDERRFSLEITDGVGGSFERGGIERPEAWTQAGGLTLTTLALESKTVP